MSEAATRAAVSEHIVRAEFTGSASEYFRIWVVNLFFTLVALGVYSAWAKVRKKRYFYGSTKFDGDSFDYFGSPKAILKGRIITVAVFLAYAFAGELYPESRYAFWIAGLLSGRRADDLHCLAVGREDVNAPLRMGLGALQLHRPPGADFQPQG